MGLRCLIGHDYGEPRTERDRRQRGSEVVVTAREYRECTRCGHRRIISENKEVTVGEPAEPTAAPAEASTEASWSPPDDEPGDADDASGFAPPGGAGVGADREPMTAAEDDGVILDEEPEAPPRAYGEWPEAEVGGEPGDPADDHGPWPDEASDPAPADAPDASPAATDPLDAGPEPTGDTRAPSAAGADAAGEPADEGADGPDEPTAAADPLDQLRPDDRDTELVCPDCGEHWPGLNASLRPGDICPECHRGYLDEQVIQ